MIGRTVKTVIVASLLAVFAGAVLAENVQAARLGGGRSLGAHRQAATPLKQAGAASRWLAPFAALAAGIGLGWLFSHGGFGGAVLMAMLVAVATLVFARLLGRPRAEAPQSLYAGLGNETVAAPPPSQFLDNADVQPDYRSQFVSNVPRGFEVEGFLKEAKRNFLRVQEANDRGDLQRLRHVTTAEMFDALTREVPDAAGTRQTDVVTLNASLIEVVTEARLHWASVRFSGSIREDAREAAHPFAEIWHLQKPVDGSSGWLLAGIQQLG